MSIQGFKDRIKSILGEDAAFYTAVILIVAIASFGLGRWSVLESGQKNVPPVVIYSQSAAVPIASESIQQGSIEITSETPLETLAPEQPALTQKTFVGSRNSDKYHFPWCSGARRIKEENKIWFATKEEAESAGYIPAANCKGL